MMLLTNLSTGYHRDLQLLKETTFPAFEQLNDCLKIAQLMLENISIKKNLLDDKFYSYLFSVEEVNRLVLEGMPFRDAYKKVGMDIEKGDFTPGKKIKHSHEGSIGQLCLPAIKNKMDQSKVNFEEAEKAEEKLWN
jgi:argininosuccinate lyase